MPPPLPFVTTLSDTVDVVEGQRSPTCLGNRRWRQIAAAVVDPAARDAVLSRHGRVVQRQLTGVEDSAADRGVVLRHGRSVQRRLPAVPQTAADLERAGAVLDGQVVQHHDVARTNHLESPRRCCRVEGRGPEQRQVLVDVKLPTQVPSTLIVEPGRRRCRWRPQIAPDSGR